MADSRNLPKDFKGYKLGSVDDLRVEVDMGIEVNFFLRGMWYLVEWRDNTMTQLMLAECPDGDGVIFDGWDALLDGYLVDGVPIGSLWREFEMEYPMGDA